MEFDEEELLVCLNFDDKIDQNFFKKPNIFFNAFNLNSQRPFIQIDRHVFQGSYEECLGSNVFLQEVPEPRTMDKIFQTSTPMHLEHLNTSAKILNLKWVNVLEEVKTLNESECVNIKFMEDYQTVLDKIDNGTLDIQDAITKMQEEKLNNSTVSVSPEEPMQENAEIPEEDVIQTIEVRKPSISSQDLLKRLIEPDVIKEDYVHEILQDHLFNIENCESFAVLKQLFVNHLNNQTNFLNDLSVNLANANIFKLINVEKSIQDGVIVKPESSDNLSDEQKQSLLSIRNFDNLSLPLKIVVLTEYLIGFKRQLQKMSEEQLKSVDKFNRTPKERYKLLKSLARDMEYILLKHLTMQSEKEGQE